MTDLREQVARIADPEAWAGVERARAHQEDAHRDGRDFDDANCERYCAARVAESLEVADQILALPRPAPGGESGWRVLPDNRSYGVAPHNGKPVLLWKAATKEHYVAAWVVGDHPGWWCTPDGFEIFGATHWQSLPEGPTP